jgi:uncharacterized protein (TIGR02266 family)
MSRRIVVIDDAPLFRELETRFLSGSGEVLTAVDGTTGLELVRSDPPHVVVVDLEMPGMSGAQVCRAIKTDPALAGVGVILITDGENPEDRARSVRAGADDVLSKPINRVSLIQAVSSFGYSSRRQLKRVPVTTPVRIVLEGGQARGVVRNLSRGGIFLEADCAIEQSQEVELVFDLPDAPHQSRQFATTAKVVWRRKDESKAAAGMGLGLQFLALDRANASRLDDFIYERTDTPERRAPALEA